MSIATTPARFDAMARRYQQRPWTPPSVKGAHDPDRDERYRRMRENERQRAQQPVKRRWWRMMGRG